MNRISVFNITAHMSIERMFPVFIKDQITLKYNVLIKGD